MNGGFSKSNWAYFLWFIVYFLIAWLPFGASLPSFITILVIYAISIGIALSPLGEALLRIIQGITLVKTEREKEYLMPLFEEVYQNCMNLRKSLNKNIKLYISNSMIINAFAIGRKTIVLTRGAIEGLTEDELKGVIAHEFGHIANGDTKALLLNTIGNGIFSLLILLIKLILFILQLSCAFATGSILATGIIQAIRTFFEMLIFLFLFIGRLILSLNSRYGEYLADDFAYGIGFGDNLIDALYTLKKVSMGGKFKLTERLQASHPDLENRISRLETKTAA